MRPSPLLPFPLVLTALLAQQPMSDPKVVRPMAFMLGGDQRTSCIDAATCDDGGFVVVGSFAGTVDFDPGERKVTRTSASKKGFVVRYGPNGQCRWVVPIGDAVVGVSVASRGRTIVYGFFHGKVDFDSGPEETVLEASNRTCFLASYDRDGGFERVHLIPTREPYKGAPLLAHCSAVDRSGNFILGGAVVHRADPKSRPPEGFLVKHDNDGKILWAKTKMPGIVSNLTVDHSGRVFVAQMLRFLADKDDPRSRQSALRLVCFDANGKEAWSHDYKSDGGSISSTLTGLVCDGQGVLYLCATLTGMVDMDPGPDVKKVSAKGGIVVARFAKDGKLLNVFSVDGDGVVWPTGITVDAIGDAYIAGGGQGRIDFDPGKRERILKSGHFVAKYTPSGNLVWVRPGRSITAKGQSSRYNFLLRITVDPAARQVLVLGKFANDFQFEDGPRVRCSANKHHGLVLRLGKDGATK